MAITWTDSLEAIDWEALSALYRAAPLREASAEDFKLVFQNSMFRAFAFEDGALVGAGRVLADGADCAYLCDIAIAPTHQGRGLGGEIMNRLIDLSKGHNKIILYAVIGKEGFYKRFGFERMTTAMAIFKNQQSAKDRGYLADD